MVEAVVIVGFVETGHVERGDPTPPNDWATCAAVAWVLIKPYKTYLTRTSWFTSCLQVKKPGTDSSRTLQSNQTYNLEVLKLLTF